MNTHLTSVTKSARAKVVLTLLAALAVLGTTALAVFGAPGTVKDTPGAAVSGAATQNADKRFALRGNLSAPLVLGASGTAIDLVVENPNPQTLVVNAIRIEVASVAPAGCAASSFSVAQTSATITVPPRSSRQLDAAARPRVAWVNDPNAVQDACVGAALTFRYSGKGTLR